MISLRFSPISASLSADRKFIESGGFRFISYYIWVNFSLLKAEFSSFPYYFSTVTYHVSPIFCSASLLDRELHAFKIAFFAFFELLSILEIKVARRSGKRASTTFGRAVTVKTGGGWF